MENLQTLEERHGLVGYLDWDFWRKDGYVLPWEREQDDEAGAPGATASQGGLR